MTALERLKAKIEEWKGNYETIAKENIELKKKLEDCGEILCEEEIDRLQAEIDKLKQEIEEKDIEIESILESINELYELD